MAEGRLPYVLVAEMITESEDGPWKTSDIDMIRGVPHNGSRHDVHTVRDKFLGCWLSAVSQRACARFHRNHVVGRPSESGRLTYTRQTRPLNRMVGTIRGKTRRQWARAPASRFLLRRTHSDSPILTVAQPLRHTCIGTHS